MKINVPLEKLEKIVNDYVVDYAKRYNAELEKKYKSLIEKYYKELTPDKHVRKYRLYDSYETYIDVGRGSVSFGIRITGEWMDDFQSIKGDEYIFKAQDWVDKFMLGDNGMTYHGGDYHGGYGRRSKTSIYNTMVKYADELVNKL